MFRENNKIISGIFFMLAASAFIGGTAAIAKLLGKDNLGEPLSPFQISQSRFLYEFIFVLLFSLFYKVRIDLQTLNYILQEHLWDGWVTILFGFLVLFQLMMQLPLTFQIQSLP